MDMYMIIKTGFAILITTLFAGGAVYYGTQATENNLNKDSTADISLNALRAVQSPDSKSESAQGMPTPATPSESAAPQPKERLSTADASDMIIMVMEQTEKISSSELKDQAYLDVVDFAIAQKFYQVANKAMLKIEQVELRDTARSHIAIALARRGRAQEAFEIINEVEIKALQDVMRLQVIEAMMLPQRPPLQMQ